MRITSIVIVLSALFNGPFFHAAKPTLHSVEMPCAKCNELLTITSPILAEWFIEVQKKDPTVHIMQAYRNEKEQNRALKSGASGTGWGKSAHNYMPSLAIDLFFMIDGKSKQIPAKYKKMTLRLPPTLENGSSFMGLIDWCHFQVKNWQALASNYPYGNVIEPK
jgi:hypothetical protein